MSKSIKTIDINCEVQGLADKTQYGLKLLPYSIFTLCNKCLWSATYFDKNRLPHENRCPICVTNNNELSSLPIMQNESYVFSYDVKRGLEIELSVDKIQLYLVFELQTSMPSSVSSS
jgi:hypothetical protein